MKHSKVQIISAFYKLKETEKTDIMHKLGIEVDRHEHTNAVDYWGQVLLEIKTQNKLVKLENYLFGE